MCACSSGLLGPQEDRKPAHECCHDLSAICKETLDENCCPLGKPDDALVPKYCALRSSTYGEQQRSLDRLQCTCLRAFVCGAELGAEPRSGTSTSTGLSNHFSRILL